MAIKSTIFKANLQIADIDHGYYADHALTLARHPSETDERMMVRLAALALQAHQLNDVCHGDGQLEIIAGRGKRERGALFIAGPDTPAHEEGKDEHHDKVNNLQALPRVFFQACRRYKNLIGLWFADPLYVFS